MKGADQRSNINDELSPDEQEREQEQDPQQQLLFLDSEAYQPAVKMKISGVTTKEGLYSLRAGR